MKTKYSADGVVSLLIILISLLLQACSPPAQSAGVMQTEDNENAKDIQRDALLGFSDQEVYSVFDPPFYKVRIGDFVNWHDAEKLQQLAIKKGYKDAWIIPSKINLKRAYQWMDEL